MAKRKGVKQPTTQEALDWADMALSLILGSRSLAEMRKRGAIMVARMAYEMIRPMNIRQAEYEGQPHIYLTIDEIKRQWAKEGAIGHEKPRQSSRKEAHLPQRGVSNRSSAAGRKPTKTKRSKAAKSPKPQ